MTFSPETRLDALAHVRRQWALPELSLEAQEAQEETLRRALASRVEDMLNNHFGQLVHALRRLDVRENDFHAAMHLDSSPEIAEALAVLILQREFEKAESRRKYRSVERESVERESDERESDERVSEERVSEERGRRAESSKGTPVGETGV